MKIPNNNQSFVADNKITDYLISEIHETGKYKAYFFKSFGFNLKDINILRSSLIQHSKDRSISKIQDSEFGIKYELKCKIKTPDDRNPCIVTVWLVEKESSAPKLITAYPSR